MAAHRAWRIRLWSSAGSAYRGISELQFRGVPGGANLIGGGTWLQGGAASFSGGSLAGLIDGNFTTYVETSFANEIGGPYFGYDWGAANPQDIAEVAIAPITAYPTEAPSYFTIEWSDDLIAWTVSAKCRVLGAWTTGTYKTFSTSTGDALKIVTSSVIATSLLERQAVATSSLLAASVLNGRAWVDVTKVLTASVLDAPPPLDLTAVVPVSGSPGVALELTGAGFEGDATVEVGGVAAENVVVVSPTKITCTAPVHALGVVAVSVTTGGNTVTLAAAFEYLDPFRIDSTAPSVVHETGDVEVVVVGAGYAADVQILVAGAPVPTTFVSETELHATVPPRAPGATTLTVQLADGSTRTTALTYEAATISAIAPNPTAPQTTITITGKWFFTGALVRIGGVFAETTYVSSTQLTAKVPVLAPGTYDVEVLNTAGGYFETLVLENGLDVTAPPVVYSSNPIVMYVIT